MSAFERKGLSRDDSNKKAGCSEVNNIKQATSREERCTPKDIEGSKAEDEGSFSCASERETSSGKFKKKKPLAVDLDVDCVKGGFYFAAVDSPGRISDYGYHIQGGGGGGGGGGLVLISRSRSHL